jgi:hypothetical protein
MKWVNRLSATLLGLIGIGIIREFFSRYDVLVFDKNDVEEARQEQSRQINPIDLRGTPTHECICGCRAFFVKTIFDNYEIGTYFLDMQCVECGALLTAPTPLDREIQE